MLTFYCRNDPRDTFLKTLIWVSSTLEGYFEILYVFTKRAGADPGFQKGGWMADGGSTRHLGNYPQDPGNEVAIKPEHRLSTWVGKRERFPTNFAIMSQSESYFASLGVVKWLPCELLREKWRQTTKRGVTTTRHERELIFLSFFIFYFK